MLFMLQRLILAALAASLFPSAPVLAAQIVSPATDPDFWTIHIENGPAPSPEDGPPGARNATRDRRLLPFQICGIVGGYLLCVLIIGISLLTFGKRKRHEALMEHEAPPKELELVKSPGRMELDGPKSPGMSSTKSWIRNHIPLRSPRKSDASFPTSPGIASVSSFDTRVIENDKQRAQVEMESLYAAVLAHDARRSEQSLAHPALASPTDAGFTAAATRPVNKNLLRIATGNPSVGPAPLSPTSPSYRPYQSADRLAYGLVSPTTPGSIAPGSPGAPPSPLTAGGLYPATKPSTAKTGTHASIASRLGDAPPAGETPLSPRSQRSFFGRQSRATSVSSAASKSSKTRRPAALSNIRISRPFAAGDEEDRTPLTPTTYHNVPRPPSPPTQPPTPMTADSLNRPPTQRGGPLSHDPEAYEAIEDPAPLPKPAPQRTGSYPNNLPTVTFNSDTPRSSTNDLPLRSAHNSTTELPLRAAHNPGTHSEAKTTVLERKKDNFSHLRGPTSALRTATTPYSPYMPFTPITPVTPHLVSRKERKQLQKEDGRKAKFQSDQVINEDEMWGSAL